MRNVLALIAVSGALALLAPAAVAENPDLTGKSATTAGTPNSDRTPSKQTTIPLSQVDTTKNGATSDRTPSNEGAAAGEQGVGSGSVSPGRSQMETWDQTYQSDIAQENQLKAGGKM